MINKRKTRRKSSSLGNITETLEQSVTFYVPLHALVHVILHVLLLVHAAQPPDYRLIIA
jgi:hypothetical protein